MKYLLFFVIILLLISNAYACQTSIDSLASEVILSKSGIDFYLTKLAVSKNILVSNNQYIIQSQYNKNIATVLSINNDFCEQCLQVRLQIPAETKTFTEGYFSMVSSFTGKFMNRTEAKNYKDWIINSDLTTMEIKKEKYSINVNYAGQNYDIILSINKELANCNSCDGKCVSSKYGEACIDLNSKQQIEEVLEFLGLIKSFDELFYNYKVLGKGEKTVSDLSPVISPEINWNQAMKQELEWLQNQNIITISSQDINSISSLAGIGKAGNSKIVYENSWKYYYDTNNAVINQFINCQEFPKTNLPGNLPTPAVIGLSNYYLIPLFITGVLIALLIFLIIIARTYSYAKTRREYHKNHKKHHASESKT